MPRVSKKSSPAVNKFQGTGLLARLNFKVKVYTAAVILIIGILGLGYLFAKIFDGLQQDLIQINQTNEQIAVKINHLKEISPTLLNRCQTGLLAGNSYEVSDIFSETDPDINGLSSGFGKNRVFKSLKSNYHILSNQLNQYSSLGLNNTQYLEIKQIYNKYFSSILQFEKYQSQHLALELFRPLFNQCGILFLSLVLLFLLIQLSRYLLMTALRSITEPAQLLTSAFNSAKDQIFQIELPIVSSEGLGKAGLLIKDAISQWNVIFSESQNSIKMFDGLCKELVSEIRKTELFTMQLQGVTDMVVENVRSQNDLIKQAQDNLAFLINQSETLHKIPTKLNIVAEELNDLLAVIEIQSKEILSKPIVYQDDSAEIKDLADHLTQASGRIINIVEVLKEVGERTELLAFNTAIQAARAGEKGRGFSVVAKEIAKLVDLSKHASSRLGDLLTNIQEKNQHILKIIAYEYAAPVGEETVYQEAAKVCSDVFETTRDSFDYLRKLTKVIELIFIKSNELAREADLLTNLSTTEGDLGSIGVEVLDYQLNIKEANRVATKISERSEVLHTAVGTNIDEEILIF